MLKDGLPLPGAVSMFCATGAYWGQGDSVHLGKVLLGEPVKPVTEYPYYKNVDSADPLAFPVHSRLIAAGAKAGLHVWEGLGHAFFYDPDLPQSREAHDVTVRFFERHLGTRNSFTTNPGIETFAVLRTAPR